jgi:hypothetical protein
MVTSNSLPPVIPPFFQKKRLLRIFEPHGDKQLFAAVESATVVGVEHDLTHKVSSVSALREYTSSTSVLRKVSNVSALVYLLYEGTI